MKHLRYTFFFIFLLISVSIQAQQNHFLYLQTDNKQPFYIKIDKKVYSSSISGYLILSKLKVGVYNFTVGFPKNEWPEQNIRCAIEDKDYGYLLKNFGEKGWGFFNLQTLNIVMADEASKTNDPIATVKTDTFSNMLSTVVNDPTIKQDEIVKPAPKKLVKEEINTPALPLQTLSDKTIEPVNKTVINENKKDNTVDTSKATAVATQLADKQPASTYSEQSIVKKGINKTADGQQVMYIDEVNGVRDTVTIFIPADKIVVENLSAPPDTNSKNKTVIPEDKKDTKFLAMDLNNPNATAQQTKPDAPIQKPVSRSPMRNSDCKNYASEEDFLKLRKKMAATENADDMIRSAKKVFKVRCFTTDQIKNLSVLFLKDMEKYNFFDMAYPFASDSENYPSLQAQLTDSYYVERFKVMIRHN